MQSAKLDVPLVFGFQEEWKFFREQHQLFLERYPNLKDAIETAFSWTSKEAKPIDKFVHFYGRLCVEDFFEVLLCCGNGYGAAALKLLRSLYEHAVTLRYLNVNPDMLDDFYDYHAVSHSKELTAVEEAFGKDAIPEKSQYFAKVREHYESVKSKFKVTACKECGAERINHTWNKLDFVSMAKKTEILGKLLFAGYYLPIRHAHGTFASLDKRLEITETGGLSFSPTAQRGLASTALITAHEVLLEVLKIQEERFKLPGLEDKIKICEQDFLDINLKGKER
jgi:hypothetical protein